jgi:hypothetical protein
LYQQLTGDYSDAGLVIAKRDINEGGAVFLSQLRRKINKEYISRSLTAAQAYYQFPAGLLRMSEVKFLSGTNYYRAALVTDEDEWNAITAIPSTATYPQYYYIRGDKELGVYPTPSATVASGIQLSHEPQHVDLTQDDYTTGTLTVTNDNIAVTHSATGFLPQMVGRYLQVTDGTDGKWYRIASYGSTNSLNLENYYEGISGSGRTFRIGEVMKIPQGYQDAPVYYAVERFYMTQNDRATAAEYNVRFKTKLKLAKEAFGSTTSRLGVKSSNIKHGRRPQWIDFTPPVTYP